MGTFVWAQMGESVVRQTKQETNMYIGLGTLILIIILILLLT